MVGSFSPPSSYQILYKAYNDAREALRNTNAAYKASKYSDDMKIVVDSAFEALSSACEALAKAEKAFSTEIVVSTVLWSI